MTLRDIVKRGAVSGYPRARNGLNHECIFPLSTRLTKIGDRANTRAATNEASHSASFFAGSSSLSCCLVEALLESFWVNGLNKIDPVTRAQLLIDGLLVATP